MESFELDTAATSSSDVGALNQKSDFENATSGSDSDGYEDNTTERLLGDEPKGAVGVVDDSPETIALRTLHTSDNPALNPWTLRMFILGIGLSCFGSALATISLFKPQAAAVSVIFLTVISYVAGTAMSTFLPRRGIVGRWTNPQKFNSKEHLAIIVMASSASGSAFATEVLATQKLYYDIVPNPVVAILLLMSSQLVGYGMAGILRESLVYPTKMYWPRILPLNALVQTLHREVTNTQFNFFWTVLGITAVWELLPQYVMPVLTGVSIFCLAKRDSLVFTNIFGGASGNEGLGLFSICFDWQYITTEPLVVPLVTLANALVGAGICVTLFIGLFYGNAWHARDFPFLSQQLFSQNSSSTSYTAFNQSAILNERKEVDLGLLEAAGLPFFTTTTASYLLSTSLAVTATVAHVALFHPSAIKDVFALSRMVASRSSDQYAKVSAGTADMDPHYRQMLVYKEVPAYWYILLGALSTITGLACTYYLESTLPWYGFILAISLSFISTLFLGALSGLLGFDVPISSVIQLLGGYILPGKPVANMYFVLFGANSQRQANSLIEHLKLGQYGKLSPRCTFTVQIIGTVVGAIVNYILMDAITTNQRDILLSIQGTNIWSGQVIQSFNSNAIAFGGLSNHMFSIGQTYDWVVLALPIGFFIPLPFYLLHRRWPSYGFDHVVTPIICWCSGYLSAGINSSIMMHFAVGFLSQYYVRRRYPRWFMRYNYLLAAAISGGTELLVFVTTFAVQGAVGKEVPFPPYWGNNYLRGNFDYCMKDPALDAQEI